MQRGGDGSGAGEGVCLSFFECGCRVLMRMCKCRFRGPTRAVGRGVKVEERSSRGRG